MRYVVAIGGNALSSKRTLRQVSRDVVKLFDDGNQVVITHGNGPQVGKLALHEHKNLAVLTGETQLEIGEEIKQSLLKVPKKIRTSRITIVPTKVVVDAGDPEFGSPSKPIGKFYGEVEAERLAKKGFFMKHLMDGYRRLVPSPKPMEIEEKKLIEKLLENRHIVIAAGGGGMAMTRDSGGHLAYADAVIDKDLASALLAVQLKADNFFILTNVDGVYLNYEKRGQKKIAKASVAELVKYEKKGQFEAGSMLPKVKACIEFVSKTGNHAVIGSLDKADSVFKLRGATVVTK
jgi:carbamate kinase